MLQHYMKVAIVRLSQDTPSARAEAAGWRHNAGREIGEDPVLYGKFLLEFPSELQPKDGSLSPEMRAAWLSLTLYVLSGKLQKEGISLGMAVAGSDQRRQNAHARLLVVESTPYLAELGDPLRAVIQMVSSNPLRTSIDYVRLSSDLAVWDQDRLRVIRRWESDAANAARKEKTKN
jgi:CRISPR type I-E-associated protein CasB/Cse2